jgi:hypothetical protein
MEMKMRKLAIAILGGILITGLTAQIATASQQHGRKAHRAILDTGEQFRNANNWDEGRASCQNRESGNPYNEQTDFEAWSAWRSSGAWDSHNDCW